MYSWKAVLGMNRPQSIGTSVQKLPFHIGSPAKTTKAGGKRTAEQAESENSSHLSLIVDVRTRTGKYTNPKSKKTCAGPNGQRVDVKTRQNFAVDAEDTDEDEQGDQLSQQPIPVDYASTDSAYKFGGDLVPLSAEDQKALKKETQKGIYILGFLRKSEVSAAYSVCRYFLALLYV